VASGLWCAAGGWPIHKGWGFMSKIRVRLFGTTSVVLADGSTVTDLGGVKPRQVLEILALSVGSPVSKDRLVEALWGDTPPRTYLGTLESYISLLRRRLGVARGRGSALATTSNGYLLDPALVEVDVAVFRAAVSAGPTPALEALAGLEGLEAAVGSVGGELLASEPYAGWAAEERSRFEMDYVQACNRAAGLALETGRGELAVEMARRAIGVDAMSEASWQLLIRGLAATGARAEALRAYLELRTTLVEALGTEPSATSRGLYLELLAEDSAGSAPASSVHEVRTLLGLLRDALDGLPEPARTPTLVTAA
jgi:DNA-binding SARP family transcriptional activator